MKKRDSLENENIELKNTLKAEKDSRLKDDTISAEQLYNTTFFIEVRMLGVDTEDAPWIQCTGAETGADIKMKIAKITKHKVEDQRLLFANTKVPDTMTVSELVVAENQIHTCRLHFTLDIDGGGKRAKTEDGDALSRDDKMAVVKDDIVGKMAIINQTAGDNATVQKVVAEINQVFAVVDTAGSCKQILAKIPKDALGLVVEATGCGNTDHKIAVLSKAVFHSSIDQVRALEGAFAKLSKNMKLVIELLLIANYFEEGSMNWKQFTRDVFAAK